MAEIIKKNENTWMIVDGGVYFFVLEGESKAAVIDTGMTIPNAKELAESVTSKPLILLNTHCDRDHIAGNDAFPEVWMHASELAYYCQKDHGAQVMHALFEGDEIDLGGRVLRVVALPGHTAGSACYLDVNSRVLISGDSIQRGGRIFLFGAQRNMPAYVAGLKRLKTLSLPFDEIWPSHAETPLPSDILDAVIEDGEAALRGELPFEITEVHGNKVKAVQGKTNVLLMNE